MAVNKTAWPLRENYNISDFEGLLVCENKPDLKDDRIETGCGGSCVWVKSGVD